MITDLLAHHLTLAVSVVGCGFTNSTSSLFLTSLLLSITASYSVTHFTIYLAKEKKKKKELNKWTEGERGAEKSLCVFAL